MNVRTFSLAMLMVVALTLTSGVEAAMSVSTDGDSSLLQSIDVTPLADDDVKAEVVADTTEDEAEAAPEADETEAEGDADAEADQTETQSNADPEAGRKFFANADETDEADADDAETQDEVKAEDSQSDEIA